MSACLELRSTGGNAVAMAAGSVSEQGSRKPAAEAAAPGKQEAGQRQVPSEA